jgi:hypothetical protein
MRNVLRMFGVAVSFALPLQGCARTQESFLTIQICLGDRQGVTLFLDTMREIAKAENLTFIDGSTKTATGFRTMGADKHLKQDPARIIHVGIEGGGGMGVTAGNLGLPPYQVALGFTEGAEAGKAHRLAKRIVQALSQYWQVETVLAGKGALPMERCKNEN